MSQGANRLASLVEEYRLGRVQNRLLVEYAAPSDQGHPNGPYPYQVKFHAAGATFSERAIIAANQTGKTRTAGAEVAMHLTGAYPSWWTGRRFNKPVQWIVCGGTNEDLRDIQQLALFGSIGPERSPDGTGWVPKTSIGEFSFRQCGVTGVLDRVLVRHASGGWSLCSLKSYEQGPEKFQGRTVDGAWLDEEPDDYRIFTECQTRTVVKGGTILFTNTPLKGMSDIVRHFLEARPGTWWIGASWEDVPHISPEKRKEWSARYPQHERDTRTRGIPLMGSGLVYPVPDEMILCEPFQIPRYYRRIAGADFGIDHPGAGGWLAHDADCDIVYLYDAYRQSGETPAYHAQAFISRGRWIPVAWPHDGMQRDKGSGVPIAHQYRARGVNMLGEPAQWDSEVRKGQGIRAQSREAGAMELLERMQTGRFKVFNSPGARLFLDEKRLLHRKDGQIVPINDDIESTVRYGLMMLRCALPEELHDLRLPRFQPNDYDPLEGVSRGTYGGFP